MFSLKKGTYNHSKIMRMTLKILLDDFFFACIADFENVQRRCRNKNGRTQTQ